MAKKTTLQKKSDLLARVAKAVNSGKYLVTNHAYEGSKDRLIPVPHIEHVLLHGFHESRKDRFDTQYQEWNYAIRGRSPDRLNVRVIVTFTDDDLLVVTVINLDK